jgi:hypothetical protein
MVRLESTAVINSRRHFVVTITRQSLVQRPLTLPVFEIVDGRRGRILDSRSADGRRALLEGTNVLYVGATNIFGSPVRNIPLRRVLEGLLMTASTDSAPFDIDLQLRVSIEAHIAELSLDAGTSVAGAA